MNARIVIAVKANAAKAIRELSISSRRRITTDWSSQATIKNPVSAIHALSDEAIGVMGVSAAVRRRS